MDPNETFRLWQKALLEENAEEAKEYYQCLIDWLNKGGFKPTALYNPHSHSQFWLQFNQKTGRLDR